MRVCKKCGEHNPVDAWSCSNCGATLSVNTIFELDEAQTEQSDQQSKGKNHTETEGGKMYCPNCGTQNADNNRFCSHCGAKLPITYTQVPPPEHPLIFYTAPSDPISHAATIGGIGGMAGGALTVLGWLVPWVSMGGLVNTLLSLLKLGSRPGLFNFGLGIGNGLQISCFPSLRVLQR